MNLKDFEKIKKELEKYPLKIRYIYLLQIQKYIKDNKILKEIDLLLKEIEAKFAHDKTWKQDVLTTLINQNRNEEQAIQSDLRNITRSAGMEEIIHQEQIQKPQEEKGITYGGSENIKYGDKSYFKSYDDQKDSRERIGYGATSSNENFQEQQEKFAQGGYSTRQSSLEEEREEYAKGERKHKLYK